MGGFVFSSEKNVTSCCTPSSKTTKSPRPKPGTSSFFLLSVVTVAGRRTSKTLVGPFSSGVGVGFCAETAATRNKGKRINWKEINFDDIFIDGDANLLNRRIFFDARRRQPVALARRKYNKNKADLHRK